MELELPRFRGRPDDGERKLPRQEFAWGRRDPQPLEFCVEAVRLVQTSGRPLSEIAGDLGCSLESLRHGVKPRSTRRLRSSPGTPGLLARDDSALEEVHVVGGRLTRGGDAQEPADRLRVERFGVELAGSVDLLEPQCLLLVLRMARVGHGVQ